MRNRKITIGIVIALVFAVVSLGIAFAAFSTTLNITGSASVESSNWNVFLTTASNGSDPGSNGVSLPDYNIDDGVNGLSENNTSQSISTLLTSNSFTWSGTLKTPGDYIYYGFYVRNTGDYDASISVSGATFERRDSVLLLDIYRGSFTCTQNGVVTEESTTVCNHLTYEFFIDNTLNHNDYVYVEVYIRLSSTGWAQDGSDLPKNPVTVTATPVTITATQSSSAY